MRLRATVMGLIPGWPLSCVMGNHSEMRGRSNGAAGFKLPAQSQINVATADHPGEVRTLPRDGYRASRRSTIIICQSGRVTE